MANELEKFINNNREAFDKERPDPAVLSRMLEQMQPKVKEKPKGVVVSFRAIRLAAASVVLLAAGLTGWWFLSKPEVKPTAVAKVDPPKAKIEKAESAPVVAKAEVVKTPVLDMVDEDINRRKQMLQARIKEKRIVLAGLNDMESPASRIMAAARAYNLKGGSDEVIEALMQTLNTDPNTNVRLAALDGLARFYREKSVSKKLVQSLKKQDDPMVQISLIKLLTNMRASGILTELEKLAGDETNMKAVRDCAYSNMFTLKSS